MTTHTCRSLVCVSTWTNIDVCAQYTDRELKCGDAGTEYVSDHALLTLSVSTLPEDHPTFVMRRVDSTNLSCQYLIAKFNARSVPSPTKYILFHSNAHMSPQHAPYPGQ